MTLDEVIQLTKQALENVNPDKRVYSEFRFMWIEIILFLFVICLIGGAKKK